MRILFVTPYVPSPIRVRPYNFLRHLAAQHDVVALTLWQSEREGQDLSALRTLCPVVAVRLTRARSVGNCLRALSGSRPLQAAYCWSPGFARLVEQATHPGRRSDLPSTLQEPFDVVHVEHLRASYVGSLIGKTVPTVFDSVDCISLLLQRTARSSHSPRQRLLAALELGRTRAWEAQLMSQFDRVAATAPEDARMLAALAPESDVAVVPNGVDLDYFHRPVSAPEEATLALSGKMSYHANVSAALHFVRHIFPFIREARPDVRLKIIGSDPAPAVQWLGRDPAISVTGHVPDIRESLGSATVAVCPVTVKVGIQNKVLEAMAMEVPVVCTREGLEGLEARSGRDLLVANSPREFADQVCRLLADGGLRRQVGLAGRRYVETHHRWADAAHRLEGLYREAIDRQIHLRRVGQRPAAG